MHELSIATALVDRLDEMVRREGADGVVSLTVEVGTLSGVDPDALDMAFPVAAEGTVADGAVLRIERVKAKVHCSQCGKDVDIEDVFPVCTECGSLSVDVVSGRELVLKSMDVR